MSERRTRREFMGLTAAGVAGMLGRRWMASGKTVRGLSAISRSPEADLIVINARVYTREPVSPRAEAFAVAGGRVTAVGKTADIRALAGKRTQTLDAKQMTVVPGFTDCHNHAG